MTWLWEIISLQSSKVYTVNFNFDTLNCNYNDNVQTIEILLAQIYSQILAIALLSFECVYQTIMAYIILVRSQSKTFWSVKRAYKPLLVMADFY